MLSPSRQQQEDRLQVHVPDPVSPPPPSVTEPTASSTRRDMARSLSPELKRKPSPPQLMHPLDRLEELIRTIASTLRSYAAIPSQSAIHIATLQDFHRRAVALHPSSQQAAAAAAAAPPHHSANTPVPTGPPFVVDVARVETLEAEWWSSEIVAAWFGPHRGTKPSHRGVSSRKRGPTFGLEREASWVGLNDE